MMNLRQLKNLVNETIRAEKSKRSTATHWNRIVENTTRKVLLEDADPSKVKLPMKLSDIVKQIGADKAKEQVKSGAPDKDGGPADDDVIETIDIGGGIPAAELKPSQSTMKVSKAIEFAFSSLMKINPMFDGPGGDMGAIISSDNHLMDGHHRWIATLMVDPSASCGGAKLDMPAKQLIGVLNLVTVGVFGRTAGNAGAGKFEDFNKDKMAPLIKDILENGYWSQKDASKCVKAAQKFLDTQESDVEKLSAAMAKKFQDNIVSSGDNWKTLPDGAPDRVEMPVINADEVDKAVEVLGSGDVDISEPYANESIDIRRWNKLAGILKD